ncbi:MAG: site-specific integrase [Prevotella sp.]|nr:site-specific integrase [Prevotella sp.]
MITMIIPNLTFVYDRKGQTREKELGVVELRIGAGKKRKYLSTGIWLKPREWSNGSVVGRRDWKELNDLLQALKKRASEVVVKMVEEGSLELDAIPQLVKESVVLSKTFVEYSKEVAQRRYRKIAPGTREHYELFFRFLEGWKGIVSFADVTERNIERMDEELECRGLKECTRWNYHKIMKTFVLQAIEDGLIKKNPYTRLDIRRGNESGLKRYLSPAEFHRFETCEIPIERLRRVRDVFVFQTYTMMSYADLAAFDYWQCERIGGQVVYKGARQKNGQEFTIVLLEPALAILRRYRNSLPIISNIKYNEYLKAAVTYAGIDKRVTTHWARHTGATMLLNEGKVPIHIIQHILGHSTIRETEKTYAKLMDETIVEEMSKLQSALMPINTDR